MQRGLRREKAREGGRRRAKRAHILILAASPRHRPGLAECIEILCLGFARPPRAALLIEVVVEVTVALEWIRHAAPINTISITLWVLEDTWHQGR